MSRRRVSLIDGGQRRSSTFRSSMLGAAGKMDFLDLDDFDFDSSLGCPLQSYNNATLALVGGKALQCWRLSKHGFPVPPAFIVPTYVYSMHIGHAGCVDLINQVFESIRDPSKKAENEEKLANIRERIIKTPLNEEVIENLENFLDALPPTASVAVRSSGSAEDLASQSFAGQYDTFLYKRSIEEVGESIKLCWASMFKQHIADYATKPVFLGKRPSGTAEDAATVHDMPVFKPPKMGVLIMQMVEAEMSGVCFTRNLWGEASELMIEAVYGQGEGLVSGELTPDRYVVDKYSTKLVYQSVTEQTHMFVRSSNQDGVIKVAFEEPRQGPVLDSKKVRALTLVARAIEDFYNRPQDIEWAFDKSGTLYILQSRQITTVGEPSSLSFIPPGEGFYTYDPVHFPRPLSPWMRENYSFEYAKHHSRRCGSLIETIEFRFVHGFAFSQAVIRPPSEELERAAKAYWEKKLYEDDYREFTDFFRKDCAELQEELRSVNPASLSHGALVKHVARCFDLCAEFWKLHHTYTFPAMTIVGDFMNRVGALVGKDPLETLVLLEGASPESRGLLNREDPLLNEMYTLLSKSDEAMKLLNADEANAQWALDCLTHMPGRLGELLREVKSLYGWRLAGGYDLCTPALIETPHFFIKTLLQGVNEDPDMNKKSSAKARAIADEWKSKLPMDKHQEFEEALEVGRRFFRMRDERGLSTDLSGIGLCRRGVLVAGMRLEEQGVVFKAEHLCMATKREAIALLRGDLALLGSSSQDGMDIPTPKELERRYNYIHSADPNLIPRALGTPPPPPDPMQLPENIRRTMGAGHSAMMRGIWDEDRDGIEEPGEGVVRGVAASMGIVEGPARLVLKDNDLQSVQAGDIVVTYSCSASFNVVIGLCAGICTDYGGMLSHAAIVAREYGIPAIVGSQDATKKFKNGDLICIDTSTGTVSLVK